MDEHDDEWLPPDRYSSSDESVEIPEYEIWLHSGQQGKASVRKPGSKDAVFLQILNLGPLADDVESVKIRDPHFTQHVWSIGHGALPPERDKRWNAEWNEYHEDLEMFVDAWIDEQPISWELVRVGAQLSHMATSTLHPRIGDGRVAPRPPTDPRENVTVHQTPHELEQEEDPGVKPDGLRFVHEVSWMDRPIGEVEQYFTIAWREVFDRLRAIGEYGIKADKVRPRRCSGCNEVYLATPQETRPSRYCSEACQKGAGNRRQYRNRGRGDSGQNQ